MTDLNAKRQKLTALAEKVWPHLEQIQVLYSYVSAQVIALSSFTSSIFDGSPGERYTTTVINIPAPRAENAEKTALAALEAALLVLLGTPNSSLKTLLGEWNEERADDKVHGIDGYGQWDFLDKLEAALAKDVPVKPGRAMQELLVYWRKETDIEGTLWEDSPITEEALDQLEKALAKDSL